MDELPRKRKKSVESDVRKVPQTEVTPVHFSLRPPQVVRKDVDRVYEKK
jgi:hypothetical protein